MVGGPADAARSLRAPEALDRRPAAYVHQEARELPRSTCEPLGPFAPRPVVREELGEVAPDHPAQEPDGATR